MWVHCGHSRSLCKTLCWLAIVSSSRPAGFIQIHGVSAYVQSCLLVSDRVLIKGVVCSISGSFIKYARVAALALKPEAGRILAFPGYQDGLRPGCGGRPRRRSSALHILAGPGLCSFRGLSEVDTALDSRGHRSGGDVSTESESALGLCPGRSSSCARFRRSGECGVVDFVLPERWSVCDSWLGGDSERDSDLWRGGVSLTSSVTLCAPRRE